MRTLGISLGTRDGGIAILNSGQLVHWQMHNFNGKWNEDKLNDILARYDRYMTRYRIKWVVLKIPPSSHHTKAFLTLLEKLTKLIQYRGCLVACVTKEDLKSKVPEVVNTMSLIEHTAKLYPILLPEKIQELAARQPYHIKMFEAVLAAHVYHKIVN